MAEAVKSSRIRELHALVYGDEPDPADEDEAPAAFVPADDAELIALGHAFDAATIRHREACDALDAAENRAEARMPERPEFAGDAVDRSTVLNLTEASPTPAADPDLHLAYRDRLITAMAERWCGRASGNDKEPPAVERRAYDIVWNRLAGLIEEVSALPPPRTPQGLGVLAMAAAAQLEGAIGPAGDFRDERMAANLIRGALTTTGTQLPPIFIGFGDEPDFKDRENVAFFGLHAFPGWALTTASEA